MCKQLCLLCCMIWRFYVNIRSVFTFRNESVCHSTASWMFQSSSRLRSFELVAVWSNTSLSQSGAGRVAAQLSYEGSVRGRAVQVDYDHWTTLCWWVRSSVRQIRCRALTLGSMSQDHAAIQVCNMMTAFTDIELSTKGSRCVFLIASLLFFYCFVNISLCIVSSQFNQSVSTTRLCY